MTYSQRYPADNGLYNCTSTSSVTQEHGKALSSAAAVTAELDVSEQFCCQGGKQESSSANRCVPFLRQPPNGQISVTRLGHCTSRALLAARELQALSSFLKAWTEAPATEDIPRFPFPSDFRHRGRKGHPALLM